jgi:uncharacterized protein (TIGR00730 family)
MSTPAFSLCVYCGSRPGADPQHAQAAQALGQWIGSRGGQLVYGGGRNGLMGITALATRHSGGRVVGVIPSSLVEREWANHDCDELLVVETMHERKRIMAERSDAFLALPGGIGTFEEFFEVWTWRQLGYHDKPVGLLNLGGYYDAMLTFLNGSVREGFMNDGQMGLIRVDTQAIALAEQLVQAAGFAPEGISPQI